MDDERIDDLSDHEVDALIDALAWPPMAPDMAGFGVHEMRLVRPKEMRKLLQISATTLYRLINSGRIPRPRSLSPRVTGWYEHEVKKILETLPATKRANEAA